METRGGAADSSHMERAQRVNLNHYLPHMAVATFLVAVMPVMLVSALSTRSYLRSIWMSALAGAVVSIGIGAVGGWLWKRHRGSKDVVFGDLLVWGWLRRKRVEHRLSEVANLLALAPAALDADERLQALKDLASALESDDLYTHGHSRRVTRHAYMVARVMRLPQELQAKVRTAAALHDIGKLYTPKEILHKPDRLTDEEFAVIKEHPAKGAEMAARLNDPEIIAMIRHHHERLDGNGYPDRLSSDEIPLGARIIAVADTFDAITSSRPYRSARTHKVGIEILKKEAGSQLDEDVVDAFLAYYSGKRSLAWWANLTTAPQRILGSAAGWVQGAAVTAARAAVAATAVSALVNPTMAPAAEPATGVADRQPASASQNPSNTGRTAPEGAIPNAGEVSPDQPAATPSKPADGASRPSDSEASAPAPKPSPSTAVSTTPVVSNPPVTPTDPAPHPSPTSNSGPGGSGNSGSDDDRSGSNSGSG